MKIILRLFIPVLGLAVALPLARADQEKKMRVLAELDAPGTKTERRIMIHRGDRPPPEMKKVAFLGVETAPVAPELTAQLNLPSDAGLVVRHVVPESPAIAVLQQHDILLKLDDQLLIDPRQFAVLIRNHKAGDEVTLTYFRGGKEASAKVKLAEHEVPKLAIFGGVGEETKNVQIFRHTGEAMPVPGADLNQTLALLDHARAAGKSSGAHRIAIAGPGFHSVTVNTGNSNMVFSDEQGSLELTMKDGKKTLVAKNAKGEQLYSGPIDTPEQRQALPGEVRPRLEKLEGMQEFTFQAEVDTENDVTTPAPRGISLPLPAPEAGGAQPARPQAF